MCFFQTSFWWFWFVGLIKYHSIQFQLEGKILCPFFIRLVWKAWWGLRMDLLFSGTNFYNTLFLCTADAKKPLVVFCPFLRDTETYRSLDKRPHCFFRNSLSYGLSISLPEYMEVSLPNPLGTSLQMVFPWSRSDEA